MTRNSRSRFFRSPVSAAAVLGLAIIGAAAFRSPATPAPAPQPAAVAVIDLQKLTDGLKEFKDLNADNLVKGQDYQKKLKDMSDAIDKINADLKDVIPASDYKRRAQALADRFELQATLKARKETYQSLYDVDHGDIIHQVYDKILAAVADIAKRENYDIVLLDDRAIQLAPMGTATDKELGPSIESKRILFARDGMDITDRVITKMNNDYAAGKPAEAPKPAAAPAPAPAPTTPPPGKK
jgi:Skp family chaperone for outer membrane proteins